MATSQVTGSGTNRNPSSNRLRKLLSLDGGGIRGLSSIIILGYLMDQLSSAKGRRVEPWEEFDMIGGTSTGGITAIMLGRLRMSTDECENAYTQLADAVFAPRRADLDPRRVTDFLKANGKFDEQPLEALIRRKISDANLDEHALLHDKREDTCKVTGFTIKESHQATLMHRAAYYGQIAIVDHLRSLGEDISVKDNNGRTPLKYAARNEQIAIVDHLSVLKNSTKTKSKIFGFLLSR